MDEHREMKVTPDRYLTYRYAGASGDFNPIHLDDEFAQGDGLKLQSLSVQFRGMGVPEEEITVTTTADGTVEAAQGDNRLVRRGKVVLRS
jgi:hypothetical protein